MSLQTEKAELSHLLDPPSGLRFAGEHSMKIGYEHVGMLRLRYE